MEKNCFIGCNYIILKKTVIEHGVMWGEDVSIGKQEDSWVILTKVMHLSIAC